MGNSKSSKSKREPVVQEQATVSNFYTDENLKKTKIEFTSKPWRDMGPDFKWDLKTEEKLKKDLKEIKAVQEVTDFRVLLLGPVKAGKSSFINSIASIDRGRLAQVVMVGVAKESKTTKLREFMPTNLIEHVILSDTMGIEATDEKGFNVQDVVYLINGNVPLDYQFSLSPIDPNRCVSFKTNPDESDKSHCVAFAIDVQLVVEDNIPGMTKAKISELQDKVDKLDVPTVILLTHIDSQCENLQKIFYSVKVEKAVKLASEMFGIPELYIFPVKNYASEGSLDTTMNILHLTALKQMIHFGTDFLDMRRQHFSRSKANYGGGIIQRDEHAGDFQTTDTSLKRITCTNLPQQLPASNKFISGQPDTSFKRITSTNLYQQPSASNKHISVETVGIMDPMPTATSEKVITLLDTWMPKGIRLKSLDLTSEIDGHTFVLCQNASRDGTDIEAAVANTRKEDRSKVMFIVLHMKPEDQQPQRESIKVVQENVHYQDIKHVVDIAYTREAGIYECYMNAKAREKVMKYVQTELPGIL